MRDRGFTLIEVLISLALVSLLLGGLYTVWHRTALTHAQLSAQIDALESARVSDRYLHRQLARVTAGEQALFSGGPRSMRYAIREPRSASPSPRRLYFAGEIQGLTLWTEIGSASGHQPGRRSRLLTGLASGSFAYFGATAAGGEVSWRNSWATTRLPRLIRIDVRDRHGRDQSAYYTVGPPGVGAR